MSVPRVSVCWETLSSTAEWLAEEASRSAEKRASSRSKQSSTAPSHGVLSRLNPQDGVDKFSKKTVSTTIATTGRSEKHTELTVSAPRTADHDSREALDPHLGSSRRLANRKQVTIPDGDAPRTRSAPQRGLIHVSGAVTSQPNVGEGGDTARSQMHANTGHSQVTYQHSHITRGTVERVDDGSFNSLYPRIKHLERKVASLLERNVTPRTMPSIMAASEQLRGVCSEVLLLHSKQSLRSGVDQKLWRSGCYALVEALRRKVHESSASNDVSEFWRQQLSAFIEKCNELFLNLVEKLQDQFGFQLTDVITQEHAHLYLQPKVKIAAILCHNCFIWMGDLARYSQQVMGEKDWTLAGRCYLRAVDLAPRNGKPYNQLAVLAVYTRRKLDAIFYYIRALSVKTPILTAKESLLSLFDDISKKTLSLDQHQEKMALDERKKEEKREAGQKKKSAAKALRGQSGKGQRANRRFEEDDSVMKEVWIHPSAPKTPASLVPSSASGHSIGSGTSPAGSVAPTLVNPGSALSHLFKKAVSSDSMRKLKKYVVLRFLCLHGMLHTKIGMEHFNRVCTALERDLCQLMLQFEDVSLLLTKMMVINVFALNRILSNTPEAFVPLHKEMSKLMTVLMSAMLAACNEHIVEVQHALSAAGKTLTDIFQAGAGTAASSVPLATVPGLAKLSVLLPAVWVGVAWLNNECARRIADFPWQGLADLLNCLTSWPLDTFVDDFEESSMRSLITPGEDHLLNGFQPLQNSFDLIPLFQSSADGFNVDVLDFAVRCYSLLACARLISSKEAGDGAAVCLQLQQQSPDCYQYAVCAGHVGGDTEDVGNGAVSSADTDTEQAGNGGLFEEEEEEGEDDDVIVLDELSCESDGGTSDTDERVQDSAVQQPAQREVVTDEDDGDGSSAVSDVADAIQQLKARRDELQNQIQAEDDFHERVKELMEEQASLSTIVLTVVPRYLVLDTNCFISYLPQLEELVETPHFTFVVPLIVINELDGLKKGNNEDTGHEECVGEAARVAMAYVEKKFSDRHPRFRAMTNQGSLLNTIAFRREVSMTELELGNNDDIILRCAQQLCKTKKSEVDAVKNVVHMERNTVLVTDDRNLRVKAHLHYIPTRSMNAFLAWFKSSGAE